MLCLRTQIPETLAEAFQRHGVGMTRFVRNLYPSLDADDIAQDVFGELFHSPD